MTRDKHTIKFKKSISSNKEGLQLATPEIVAKYIAERLRTDIIADLGCGIGGQVIFFAKKCMKVYAVERNPEKLNFARENCRLYNVNNVEFILGDALSPETRTKVSDADIIFSDPARPLAEKERTLENLEPPVTEIINMYSDITEDLAFHAPPQINPSRIIFDCEREYLSLNGQLNRLTLYFGSLKCCDRSAAFLPAMGRLCSSSAPDIKRSSLNSYVYEPEPSIVKARLLNELAETLSKDNKDIFFYKGDEHRILLTSPILIDSIFFKDRYVAIGSVPRNMSILKKMVKSKHGRKAVLRFDIEPENYWRTRNMLEEGLNGTRTFHIFGFGNELIICEKVTAISMDK